jgi:hypothetical protein
MVVERSSGSLSSLIIVQSMPALVGEYSGLSCQLFILPKWAIVFLNDPIKSRNCEHIVLDTTVSQVLWTLLRSISCFSSKCALKDAGRLLRAFNLSRTASVAQQMHRSCLHSATRPALFVIERADAFKDCSHTCGRVVSSLEILDSDHSGTLQLF